MTSSGAGQVAQWARGANVVKAFHTIGFNVMANAAFAADRPVLFYCGDDTAAKTFVKNLADELGFEAVDAGLLTQARTLEPFALLWTSPAVFHGMGRDFAFQLLRR